jgi:hypothetical protein
VIFVEILENHKITKSQNREMGKWEKRTKKQMLLTPTKQFFEIGQCSNWFENRDSLSIYSARKS